MAENHTIEEAERFKKYLEGRLRGQPRAINSIYRAYEYVLTLRDKEQRKGPLGTFLFLGPSGVGKTELARLMAEYFSGSQNSLIKIPCVGFGEPHMIHLIIGAPASYIGFDSKPMLSQEYIDKRIAVQTKKTEHTDQEDYSNEAAHLFNFISMLKSNLADLCDEVEANMSLINFMGAYDRLISNSGSEVGEKSFRDLLADPDTKKTLASILGKDLLDILEQDSRTPLDNMALTLELYAETKKLIQLRKQIQADLEKAYYQLGRISKQMRIVKIAEASAVTPTHPKKNNGVVVILFDEIEKGNKTLHDLLLEIMEEGKVTLANGEVTDLSNAFIVLTGNIGANLIGNAVRGRKPIGFGMPDKSDGHDRDDAKDKEILDIAEKELDKIFSPEFKGRLDNITVFRPLSPESFRQILDDQIEIFQIALMTHNIDLEIDDAVRNLVVEQSRHRPEVGARLLNHKFKSMIKIPLGIELANKKNFQGKVRVLVDDSRVRFEFDKAPS